jgi:hypothetical protein
MASICL